MVIIQEPPLNRFSANSSPNRRLAYSQTSSYLRFLIYVGNMAKSISSSTPTYDTPNELSLNMYLSRVIRQLPCSSELL